MLPHVLNELKSAVGSQNVLTSPGDLQVYSFDSALDRSTPSAVVLPGTQAELSRVISILAKARQSYVARGAATSLCGGPVSLSGAVVVGLARLNRIGTLDKTKNEIVVEPGVVNLRLQNAIEKDGLFYAPDPGSQKACTIGGNVATNAGGPHCLKYGVTSNNVTGLEVILPDGQLLRLNAEDPGYDVLGFFVGSEGTIGTASSIRLKLLPKPTFVRTMVVSFRSIEDAIQSVTDIIGAGILPATLEAMDKITVAAIEAFTHAGYPLEAEAVLLIEVDGEEASKLDHQVAGIKAICEVNNSFDYKFAKDEAERKKLWEGRRGSYAAMARLAPNVLVEDGAVPRTQLPKALAKIKEIAQQNGLQVALLFHAGDGNLHPQIIFDERDAAQTKVVKAAGYAMLKACVDLGGTISGEHGIGIDKREAMRWLFTRETLSLFRRLKLAFDPNNLCNPDKLLPIVGKTDAHNEIPVEKPEDRVEQVSSAGSQAPKTVAEMQSIVTRWNQARKKFGVTGLKSKIGPMESLSVSTENLNRVLDFDHGNLTITVEAGVPVATLKRTVESERQYLWVEGVGSVGGMIATRGSALPPLRDQILGMRVLLSTGEIVQFGAKTMKNVAGYDAAKLLIGSWGTLGIILDVTFRLFPYPTETKAREKPAPFALKEIHHRIKKAFDPFELINPTLSNWDGKDPLRERRPQDAEFDGVDLRKFEDRFFG